MACPPKSAGTSQFQRLMTIKLISAAAAMANSRNFNPRNTRRPFMISPRPFSPRAWPSLFAGLVMKPGPEARTRPFDEFLVNRFQAPPQLQDRVMLARQQRIDAYARLGGQ